MPITVTKIIVLNLTILMMIKTVLFAPMFLITTAATIARAVREVLIMTPNSTEMTRTTNTMLAITIIIVMMMVVEMR